MAINPDQLIMDTPKHLAVWKGGTQFEVNTLPNEWVWAQCQVQICNTEDGPNSCQADWTPIEYPSTKFQLAYDGNDFDLTLHIYESYTDVSAVYYVLAPLAATTPGTDIPLVSLANPQSRPPRLGVAQFEWQVSMDGNAHDWVIRDPAFFTTSDTTIDKVLATYPRGVSSDLDGTYNGTVDSATKFKPLSSYYGSCACRQTFSYNRKLDITYASQGTIAGFGGATAPVVHELVIRRRSFPMVYSNYDSWAFMQMAVGPYGSYYDYHYLIYSSVFGSPVGRLSNSWSQQDWLGAGVPDETTLTGKHWDRSETEGDTDWVPISSILRTEAAFATGNRWQRHVSTGYTWDFCDGKMTAAVVGDHYDDPISIGGFRISRVEYLGVENIEMIDPWPDTNFAYYTGPTLPPQIPPSGSKIASGYGSSDINALKTGSAYLVAVYRRASGSEAHDHPATLGNNFIGTPLLNPYWSQTRNMHRPKMLCDYRVRLTYEATNDYFFNAPPIGSAHTADEIIEYDNLHGPYGDEANSPGPWQPTLQNVNALTQTRFSYIASMRTATQAVHLPTNLPPADRPNWKAVETGVKLVLVATEYKTSGSTHSGRTYQFPVATALTGVTYSGDVYTTASTGVFDGTDPKPIGAWYKFPGPHNHVIDITQTGDSEWVRTYQG